MDKWMNEWTTEQMIKRTNERTSERANESMNKWMNDFWLVCQSLLDRQMMPQDSKFEPWCSDVEHTIFLARETLRDM